MMLSAGQMRHDDYGHQLWKAEEMATFVTERTGLKIDNIERPSFFRSAIFPPTALAVRPPYILFSSFLCL